jgi:hypothetical protein
MTTNIIASISITIIIFSFCLIPITSYYDIRRLGDNAPNKQMYSSESNIQKYSNKIILNFPSIILLLLIIIISFRLGSRIDSSTTNTTLVIISIPSLSFLCLIANDYIENVAL